MQAVCYDAVRQAGGPQTDPREDFGCRIPWGNRGKERVKKLVLADGVLAGGLQTEPGENFGCRIPCDFSRVRVLTFNFPFRRVAQR